jgi:4-aminobutyrate--pyruvate transaminase
MNAIMQKNGLISRNMLDAMGYCPPLIVTSEEISKVLKITEQSLEELASDPEWAA